METALWVIAICVAIKTAIVLLNEIIIPFLEGLGVIHIR